MENTQHLSQFLHMFITLFNVTSEKERNGMHTFRTDLFSTGLPPQEQQVQKVRADTAFINPVVINHPTKTLNGKYPDVSVFGENQMRDFLHKSIRVVICGLVSACAVHDSFGV